MKYPFNYLVEISFLGFRFHGWQKQKNVKTLHDIVDKTLSFVFKESVYKTLGIGRTDAMVSATNYYFQLFTDAPIDEKGFLVDFYKNAPQDLSINSVEKLPDNFDLLNCDKVKEYHYYFSFDEVYHPFAAPFITNVKAHLDIDLMKLGANFFEGEHYFHKYCTKPSVNTIFKREIKSCEIVDNTDFTASFFPIKSYVLKVKGKGFLRYQIRLMMAMLFELGKGNVKLDDIKNSLSKENDRKFLRTIAPASGLQLFNIDIHIKKGLQ